MMADLSSLSNYIFTSVAKRGYVLGSEEMINDWWRSGSSLMSK